MSEIRFPSLSSVRDIFRFSAFWLAFGLLVGPVVGFLLGARSWRDLWISVQAGLLFTLPLSVMIAATRLIPPRWIGKRPVDDLRGFVSDVAIRLAITVIAALVGAGLVDALLVPGFLRSAHGMGSILIYMVVGASLFMAIDYAAGYRRSYRARVRSEEQYKARVEEGMRVAAAIQRGLLPRALPDGGPLLMAGRIIPSQSIAGDFFDYFEIENGAIAFVIGDVAGKGPPAAILAAAIQGMVAAFASSGGSPATVLGRLNGALLHRMAESRFATVVFGIVDPAGRMILANAGHPRAIVVRRDGSTARLDRGGCLLGVFDKPRLEEEEVQLRPGDSVVLFSDGVSEARNGLGEEFGDERILVTAAAAREGGPERAVAGLLDAVWRFRAGAPPEDDVTVVALRYQPRS